MNNGPTAPRGRGRPRKVVVDQHLSDKSSFNITHIIGHNSDGGLLPEGVGNPSAESVVKDSYIPPNPTAENKKVVPENPENYKKVLSEDSCRATVTSTVIASDLEERMKKYVEGNGGVSGLDCVCFHCRTFRNRFLSEMKRMLRGGEDGI